MHALGLDNPPALSGTGRPRWAFWRSPPDQPGWARPALLGIAAAAAVLYAWNITRAGLAPFYSTAVKSMSESWHAFFYGAFDPKATITIDKLAGSFLPQALSARIFGFHPWSLALPQVIEGIVSVLVMYRVVRRWAGAVPGLLAAAIFTLTPIAASMFGHSMEDGALTMCLVLAADSCQRAMIEGRLRSLVWSGVWVGLGFQAKMLQAWIILPALAAAYLLTAPVRLRRRLWHVGVAGSVMLAVSLSWVLLYTLTPASARPYVDGSTDNSAAAMVFGYNGLERFGISVPGAVTSGPGLTVRPGGGVNSGGFTGNAGGWVKLVDARFGPEIGWLYPLALLVLAFGIFWRRAGPWRGGLVLWGGWLVTFGAVYSVMSVLPHTAYVASLAPPIAALCGAGIVMFWRWYAAGDWRGWVLPLAVAAELGWAAYLWSGYRTFLPWVLPSAAVLGVAAIAMMAAARLSPRALGRLATVGVAAGVVAMLAAPAAWAGSVLDVSYGGSSFDASAGPAGGFGIGGRLGGPSGFRPGSFPARGFRPAGFRPGEFPAGGFRPGELAAGGFRPGAGGGILSSATTALSGAEQRLHRYVSTHEDGAGYLLAVQSWAQASPYILATGQEVMPLGGFSGTVPEPGLGRVEQLVRSGQLRFFLLDSAAGTGSGPGGDRAGSQAQQVVNWVRATCAMVPAKDYGGASGRAASGGTSPGLAGGGAGVLYECSAGR